MEQFAQIRRDHAREGLSVRELAKRHGVHRRAVRQALESAVPPAKRATGDVGEVFVPLATDAGVEAEVDWGEAKVLLRGEWTVVHQF